MTTMTTRPKSHVDGGAASYESKFIREVASIPVVASLKNWLFTQVPQTKVLIEYVGRGVHKAVSYPNDTPFQRLLFKLDAHAAEGLARFRMKVPINAPIDELLKKAKAESLLSFVTHWYAASVDFALNFFNDCKRGLDPVLTPFLDRVESFIGTKPAEGESQTARMKRIGGVIVEEVEKLVPPIVTPPKATVATLYANTLLPVAQAPIKQFYAQMDKANNKVSNIVSGMASRYRNAESTARDAWTKTNPHIPGPNSTYPTFESRLFVAIAFGFILFRTEPKEPASKDVDNCVGNHSHGLVVGVEEPDAMS